MTLVKHRLAAIVAFALVLSGSGFARADDKKEPKADDKKPSYDPKEVRVGAPPELAELRKAVEDAAKKGENVDEIRKQLEALEKALAGKAWVKPKPVEEPPANPGFDPPARIPGVRSQPFPNPLVLPALPGIDPRNQEAMQKAQELLLKAAVIRGEDPAKAEELMKQARELMGARPGGLVLPPPLVNGRREVRGSGSRLGVRVEKVPAAIADQIDLPAGRGVLVAEVVPDSAAEKAGLKANDIITEFAGKPVGDDPTEFVRTVLTMKAGEKVDVIYFRKGKKGEAKAIPLADPVPDRRGGREVPMLDDQPLLPFPVLPAPGARIPGDLAFPIPAVIEPELPVPAVPGVQKSKSVSVRIENGKFAIDADEDGVKFVLEGRVGDGGKAVPTKIEIKDGSKKIDAESVEKLPAEYRDRVQKLLDSVKVGK